MPRNTGPARVIRTRATQHAGPSSGRRRHVKPFASFAGIPELVCFKHEMGHITLIEAIREEGGA
jgi:hypothetical protein